MGLRIKEICKEKGLSITDIADRLGMDSSNLYSSLKGNPSLKRLTEVANALNVSVGELFDGQEREPVQGIITIAGETFKVCSVGKNVVQLPQYTNYTELRECLLSFIETSIKDNALASFMGMLESFEVFNLLYEPTESTFYLSICFSSGETLTRSYDSLCEYGDGENRDIKLLFNEIKNDIEQWVPTQLQK